MFEFNNRVPGATAEGQIEVKSPFDGKLIGKVDSLGAAGVEQALKNAAATFADKSAALPAERRVEILERTAELMQENFDELVALAVSEGGKPKVDTEAEVKRAMDGVKNCVECIRTERGTEIPMGINPASRNRLAMTTREPIGPVVAVSAFNHPLNLIVHQLGPAVATGCPVIIKPASETALSCFRFVELLREAGLPDAWCQPLLTINNEVATQLVTDERVAFFSFIGSGKVGWSLKSQLAPGTRCALEHGGIAPVIVTANADLDKCLPLLVKGGYYHAGQVCVSVQRVYIASVIAEDFTNRFVDLVKELKVGDPAKEDTDVGPLIRHSETDRVAQWVDEAVQAGAQLLCVGQ